MSITSIEYIKVYTIGIGNCSDTVLSKIATETGGEYIKAYKASDLVDIYANIGIGGDFDTTDNDGDGLYDAVETAQSISPRYLKMRIHSAFLLQRAVTVLSYRIKSSMNGPSR